MESQQPRGLKNINLTSLFAMEIALPDKDSRRSGAASTSKLPVPRSPLRKKHTVSAAAIFKKPQLSKAPYRTPQATLNVPRVLAKQTSVLGSSEGQSWLGTSPQKRDKGGIAIKSAAHPLALAFKDSTAGYRSHLEKAAITRINGTLEMLLNTIHESTYQPKSSPPVPSNHSVSLSKLSIPAKLEHFSTKLSNPLGTYIVRTKRTNTEGEEPYDMLLNERMVGLQESYVREIAELQELQRQWEAIVGEIWIVGVNCLGDEAMRSLLLAPEKPCSSPPHADNESTLYVPEQSPTPVPTNKMKKHVTFQTPDTELPYFLSQESKFSDRVAELPDLSDDGVKELESIVAALGQEETEELRSIEKEQQKWWSKKTQQIANALGDD